MRFLNCPDCYQFKKYPITYITVKNTNGCPIFGSKWKPATSKKAALLQSSGGHKAIQKIKINIPKKPAIKKVAPQFSTNLTRSHSHLIKKCFAWLERSSLLNKLTNHAYISIRTYRTPTLAVLSSCMLVSGYEQEQKMSTLKRYL
jgi:hypothetical protein